MDISALLPPGFTKTRTDTPVCHATGCQETENLGQWLRRLTDEELAVEHAIITGRREAAHLLRDTQQPWAAPGPLPGHDEFTRTVIGCTDHAVHADTASRIHAADCDGPDADTLPHCGCEPEPHPEPEPQPEATGPAHWITATGGGG